MKKTICLLIVAIMMLVLWSCGKEKAKDPTVSTLVTPEQVTQEQITPEQVTNDVSLMSKKIQVHSLAELETLKQMLKESDEKVDLNGTFGQFATREDYEMFVKLYETLPKLSLMEGEVTWICQYGEEELMITTKNENEEWFRVEYQLKATDISELNLRKDAISFEKSITTGDNRLTVYKEQRTVREDGMEVIEWVAKLDDMPVYVVYCANNSPTVTAQSLFSELTVQDPTAAVK